MLVGWLRVSELALNLLVECQLALHLRIARALAFESASLVIQGVVDGGFELVVGARIFRVCGQYALDGLH
jgi:hypothetical protein